jgi:hypothetical protein
MPGQSNNLIQKPDRKLLDIADLDQVYDREMRLPEQSGNYPGMPLCGLAGFKDGVTGARPVSL